MTLRLTAVQRNALLAAVVLLIMLSWLPQMLTFNPGLSYGDEGLIAQAAKRVVNGEWPIRDFFFAPPVSAWWYGFFLWVLGESFLALRLGVLVTSLLIMLTALWVVLRLTKEQVLPPLFLLSFLAFFGGPYWFIASLHWVSLLFCLLSLVLMLPKSGGDWPSSMPIFWAGAAGAVAALTLQHKGGLWLLAATVALLVAAPGRRRNLVVRFWLGVLAAGLPVFALLIAVSGWDQLFYQLVTFPLTRYHLVPGHRGATIFADLWMNWQNVSAAWPAPGAGLRGWLPYLTWNLGYIGRVVVHLLPFFGVLVLFALWLRRPRTDLPLALLSAFFVANYLATLHRFHETTLVFAAPAAVLILAVWIGEAKKGAGRLAIGGQALWISVFFMIAAGFAFIELMPGKVSVALPAGTVYSLYPAEAGELADVQEYFAQHRQPDDQVLCLSYLPMFYYLLDLENPTPYDILTYPINTPEQFDAVQSTLERNQTRWILLDGYSLAGVRLGPYLLSHYRMRVRIGKLTIWERVPSVTLSGYH